MVTMRLLSSLSGSILGEPKDQCVQRPLETVFWPYGVFLPSFGRNVCAPGLSFTKVPTYSVSTAVETRYGRDSCRTLALPGYSIEHRESVVVRLQKINK